jgi:biotin carboxylase
MVRITHGHMPRILLLLPTTTYRTDAFLAAARHFDAEVVVASERPSTMEALAPAGLLTLDFGDPVRAAVDAAEFARRHPIDAVVPVDDDTAVVAAAIAAALDLPHNSVASARAARDKYASRAILRDARVPVPNFEAHTFGEDVSAIARRTSYPCVVKPVFLSASRGVMRADTPEEFAAAVRRLEKLLADPELQRRGGRAARTYLVEEFVPGVEVALEGLLIRGELSVLAIFDKPDPLDGPFFEETIYVTPSRLPSETQSAIAGTVAGASRALGLAHGPIHAELRVNERGPWILEVAARSIGGLCSRTLRFGTGLSLEDLILRASLGLGVEGLEREQRPAGVMMIPIPRAGILRGVHGLDAARAVPDVEDVTISVHRGARLVPLPEGASYLGFIFARAATPERVEQALRDAHVCVRFDIENAPAAEEAARDVSVG